MRTGSSPQESALPYITADGYKRLQLELSKLWKETRPELTKRMAAAAALGDRSENGDYIYCKKRIREIDRRIRYLSTRMDRLQVVRERPTDTSRIYFGASVRLRARSGTFLDLRIVGSDEIDPNRGNISIDAPLAKQLLSRRVGNDVEVTVDGERKRYEIVEVAYDF